MQIQSQKCEDTCVCGLFIFLIFYYISYVVYGGYALISDYNLWHNCYLKCDNKIWIYCFLSIMLGFDKIYLRKKLVLNQGLLILVLVIIVEILLFIWGIVELFTKTLCLEDNCIDIFRSHLWAFSHLCFVLQIIFIILYSLLLYYKINQPSQRFREVELVSFDLL